MATAADKTLADFMCLSEEEQREFAKQFASRLSPAHRRLFRNKFTDADHKAKSAAAGGKAKCLLPIHGEGQTLPPKDRMYGFATDTLPPVSCPFVFPGELPKANAAVAIDCEGLMLKATATEGERRVAASVAIVGRGSGGKVVNLFSAFIYHEPRDVKDYQTQATMITAETLGRSPMRLEYVRDFLLYYFFRNKPTIVGACIANDWQMLQMEEGIRDLYGSSYVDKVVDLQAKCIREDGSPISLPLLVELFQQEIKMKPMQDERHSAFDDAKATYLLYVDVYAKRDDRRLDFYNRVSNCRRLTLEEKNRKKRMFARRR